MRLNWRTAAFMAGLDFVALNLPVCQIWSTSSHIWSSYATFRKMRQTWRTAAFVANIEFVCPISTCIPNLVTIGPYLADLCHFYTKCGKSGALRHLWLTLSLCALYLPVCQIWSSSDHIWPSYATFTFFGFSRIRTRDHCICIDNPLCWKLTSVMGIKVQVILSRCTALPPF